MAGSSPPPPRRKFFPEPVEVSTRSSKRPLPQPVEHTTKSHHAKPGIETSYNDPGATTKASAQDIIDTEASPTRSTALVTSQSTTPPLTGTKNAIPQPLETTSPSRSHSSLIAPDTPNVKPKRRFVPEPVETSTSSHRNRASAPEHNTRPSSTPSSRTQPQPVVAAGRSSQPLAPEPAGTSTRSNRGQRDAANGDLDSAQTPPRRRFKPEPVETSKHIRRNGKKTTIEDSESSEQSENTLSATSSTPSSASSPRKFSPQLLGTIRGSFKKGDAGPSISEENKTDSDVSQLLHVRPAAQSLQPSESSPESSGGVSEVHESRFSSTNLAKRQQTRQHSYIVPELPSITSNSSEDSVGSKASSFASSPSASSEDSFSRRGKLRESCDERFSGYILSLAAQAAEKQLREQAMAAYPNEMDHEPVDHFAVDREDSGIESLGTTIVNPRSGLDVSTFRRESAADLREELKEMRKHHARLEKSKREQEQEQKDVAESPFSAKALAAKAARIISHAGASDTPKTMIGGLQKGVGLSEMRHAASPPMLGQALVFPKSMTPKMTRCDVDQVPVPRTGEDDNPVEEGPWAMWTAKITIQNNASSGLWMGLCHKAHNYGGFTPTKVARSGLLTPAVEEDDPHSGLTAVGPLLQTRQLPSSPPDALSDSQMSGIDTMLSLEQEIEREFDNSFVTQIYNYLSLGYPSLAHPFDDELSKISRIPVADLRKGDEQLDAKGYVGAPEGEGVDEDHVDEGGCVRWTALKLYIREWARQQKDFEEHHVALDSWGARARRGSWAI